VVVPASVVALVAFLLTGAPQAQTDQSWRAPMLAAFDEVWQTIHDTYHDPTFGGLDWPGVRDELRPRVEAARNAEEVRGVIRQMLARLGKSHFALMAPTAGVGLRGDAHVSIDVRLVGRDVVITHVDAGSSAAEAGLAAGQILRRVDDEAASSWLDTAVGAKTESASYSRIAGRLHLPPDQVLFVSDVTTELRAARAAGMRVVLSLRSGNRFQADADRFDQVRSLDEIV